MLTTVHTARTLMFAELEKTMDFSIENDSYIESLNNNIIGKKSADGIKSTTNHLTTLYTFDTNLNSFKALKHFWRLVDNEDKVMLALLFAIGNDYLLEQSISIVSNTKIGDKVSIEILEDNLERLYPEKYAPTTRKSTAQNLASSWKQAGFITGRIKNIRTQPNISSPVAAFAFFLSFLNGDRGEFILTSKFVKALMLNEKDIRELAIEAAKRDLIQYQYGGNVTSFAFSNLINKLEINDI